MNILKVEFQLQDGWESFDTLRSRMGAFGRFAIVEPLDVVVDTCFPFFSVEELLHPCGGGKRLIPLTERAIPGAGKGSTVDERIALDGKRFRPPQVVRTVTAPLILAEDPLAALEAQLGKAAGGHESLFVAAIDVSPSLGHWFATGTDTGQPLASCKDEGGYDEPIGVQLMVGHQATASFAVASREIG